MTTTWTKINKAGGSTINPGNPIGLLLALTYSTTSSTPGTGIWNKVTKATGTSWNKVTKATGTSWNKVTKAT